MSESLGEDIDGIDRQRINQDEARSHFLPPSDRRHLSSSRSDEKRRGHRSLDRRQRLETNNIINGVTAPSDEEEESLERRLARLRREITEVQGELQRENEKVEDSAHGKRGEENRQVESLATMLDAIEMPTVSSNRHAATSLVEKVNTISREQKPPVAQSSPLHQNPAPNVPEQQNDITMFATLDARLEALEEILGLNDIPPESLEQPPTKPLLPTLDILDKQISTLSTTSEVSIDKIRTRVRELAYDAENLEARRTSARKALENVKAISSRSRQPTEADLAKATDFSIDAELTSKINALYGTLSNIEAMSPLLPSVLERLRSLRDLHANAATASESLSQVEREQQDMKEELSSWRVGLEKVEKAVEQNEGNMKENTEIVEGWVKDLERRMVDLR